MARVTRRNPIGLNKTYDSGPYEAVVVNHLDPTFNGALEVELLKNRGEGNNPERSGQIITVRYLSPFYGVTPMGATIASDGYDWTQKSYGFWAVPPDIGTKVLVIFAEGNQSYGYWIGCIPDQMMNFMVPDGRASTELTTDATPTELKGQKLPVGEYNKNIETGTGKDPTKFLKPYQKDFVQQMEVQGLLADETRGTTTTSARRELPSQVFGMSTPGPLDKRPGAPKVNYGPEQRKVELPGSRLGGSSWVMDDGDDKLIRRTHASDGPPNYANVEAGDTGGDPTLPHNELVRIRTRTGHQVLLHNSEDLIYIANSRGTAWIELTSDGKIDVYGKDSISVKTSADLNFYAERDINMEAGRNVSIKASANYSQLNNYDQKNLESGRVQIESEYDMNLSCGADMKITTNPKGDNTGRLDISVAEQCLIETGRELGTNNVPNWNATIDYRAGDVVNHIIDDVKRSFTALQQHVNQEPPSGEYWEEISGGNRRGSFHVNAEGEVRISADNDMHLKTKQVLYEEAYGDIHVKSGATMYVLSASDYHNHAGGDIYEEADGSIDILAGVSIFETAGTNINLTSGGIIAGDATQIHWNSGLAVAADASTDATPAQDARNAQPNNPLPLITLPYVTPGSENPFPFTSIVPRVPQHEPWPHHENLNPLEYKTEKTDREEPGALPNSNPIITPDTFRKNTTTANVAGGPGLGANASGRGTFNQPTRDPAAPTTDRTATAQGQNITPGQPMSVDQLVAGNVDGFNSEETAAYLGAVGTRESNNRYGVVNSIGFAGKYQFGTAALKEAGMIVSTASNRNSAMDNPANWTGQYGCNNKQDWLNNVGDCQEFAMITYTNKNRRYLLNNGGIRASDTKQQQAGMLMGAHLLGAGGMRNWRRGNGGQDAYGTTGDEYFALGSASLQGTDSGSGTRRGPGGPGNTDIA